MYKKNSLVQLWNIIALDNHTDHWDDLAYLLNFIMTPGMQPQFGPQGVSGHTNPMMPEAQEDYKALPTGMGSKGLPQGIPL